MLLSGLAGPERIKLKLCMCVCSSYWSNDLTKFTAVNVTVNITEMDRTLGHLPPEALAKCIRMYRCGKTVSK